MLWRSMGSLNRISTRALRGTLVDPFRRVDTDTAGGAVSSRRGREEQAESNLRVPRQVDPGRHEQSRVRDPLPTGRPVQRSASAHRGSSTRFP